MKKLLDLDKPVQLRNGMPARIICRDAAGIFPIIALVRMHGGQEIPEEFTLCGSASFSEDPVERSIDLINTPPRSYKFTFWVAINKYGSTCFYTEPPTSYVPWKAIKKMEVDITEGEGL